MTSRIALLSILSVCAAAGQQNPDAGPQAAEVKAPPTFRSGVSNVRIDAQVTDRNHQLIVDLTAADFEVYDEGIPQRVLHADLAQEPLSLVLLLDVSGSMKKFVEQLASTAQLALRQLRPGDRVAVMIFSRGAKVRVPFTTDVEAAARDLTDAVQDDSLGMATEINRALLEAAAYLRADAETGRRAVLILTDNQGLNYRAPDEEVIRAFAEANAVVNAIVIGRGDRPPEKEKGGMLNPDFTVPNVFRIAEETGGEAIRAQQAAGVFPQMVRRIRTRYSIHYRAPEGARAYRRVELRLAPHASSRFPGAILRYRRGYQAGS
jgi:VWFA-related protein